MRTDRVLEQLPTITPALLDIAEMSQEGAAGYVIREIDLMPQTQPGPQRETQVRGLLGRRTVQIPTNITEILSIEDGVVTNASGEHIVSDLDQLGTLTRRRRSDPRQMPNAPAGFRVGGFSYERETYRDHHYEAYRRSVAALARVTAHVPDLSRGDQRKVARVVGKLTPLAITEATLSWGWVSTMPIRRTPPQITRHVVDHDTSYRILAPFATKPIRALIESAFEQQATDPGSIPSREELYAYKSTLPPEDR